jgi:hypothetical protein
VNPQADAQAMMALQWSRYASRIATLADGSQLLEFGPSEGAHAVERAFWHMWGTLRMRQISNVLPDGSSSLLADADGLGDVSAAHGPRDPLLRMSGQTIAFNRHTRCWRIDTAILNVLPSWLGAAPAVLQTLTTAGLYLLKLFMRFSWAANSAHILGDLVSSEARTDVPLSP